MSCSESDRLKALFKNRGGPHLHPPDNPSLQDKHWAHSTTKKHLRLARALGKTCSFSRHTPLRLCLSNFQFRFIRNKSIKFFTQISKKKKKSLEIIKQIHLSMTSLGSVFCFNTVKLSSYPLSF